jgi:mono/diheme cytochrome c family protein
MKHLIVILTLAVSLALVVAALPAAAQEGGDHGSEYSEDALRGAAVYAMYCQACHGPTGESIGSGPAFAAIEYNPNTARQAIVDGGDIMPAYDDVLDDAELHDLLAYMGTWESGATPPLPEPNLPNVPEDVPDYSGDPHEGAVVYASFCAGCHGPEGEGRGAFDSPEIELEAGTIDFIANEHSPAFGAESGGPLSQKQLTDLETYLASWNLETRTESEDSGLNVLIVIIGAVAILGVGAYYIARRDENPPDKVV